MKSRLLIPGMFFLFSSAPFLGATDYKQDVLPIMKEHCWDCHAGKKAKGNLDLENLDEMRDYQVGKFNIIRPGNPEESSFLEKMKLPEADRDFMPRKGSRLPDQQIAAIEKWIKEGAVIDAASPAEKEKEWVAKSGANKSPTTASQPSREYLSWTSNDGIKIEARFLGLQGEAVKLLTKSGKAYTVPFARLSKESIAAAQKLSEKK